MCHIDEFELWLKTFYTLLFFFFSLFSFFSFKSETCQTWIECTAVLRLNWNGHWQRITAVIGPLLCCFCCTADVDKVMEPNTNQALATHCTFCPVQTKCIAAQQTIVELHKYTREEMDRKVTQNMKFSFSHWSNTGVSLHWRSTMLCQLWISRKICHF